MNKASKTRLKELEFKYLFISISVRTWSHHSINRLFGQDRERIDEMYM
jgi:hypothetical protein